MWRRVSAAGFLVLAGMVASAQAGPIRSAKVNLAEVESLTIREPRESGFTMAPMAYIRFCLTYRDVCAAEAATKMELTPVRAEQLEAVNTAVNRKIRPRADTPGTDIWSLDVAAGDCDDYAVQKRKALMDLGWPLGSLTLATARTSTGEPHLVLVVRTDLGHLVLDNLRRDIVPMFRTGYRWMAMQSAANSAYWAEFNLGPMQVVTAQPRLRLQIQMPVVEVAEVSELRGAISIDN